MNTVDRAKLFSAYQEHTMTNMIQAHAAPRLVTFDKEAESGHPIARIGTKSTLITPIGDTVIAITRSDLDTLLRESYSLGWAAKCIHVKSLIESLPAEIGT